MLWKVADSAVRDLGWFSDLLPVLKINKAQMREQAWRHWATATDLAGALVSQRSLAWRTAHQIVGILVRLCEERGLGPADVTPVLLDEAAVAYHEKPAGLNQDEIRAALDPVRFIASRTVRGGPAKAESLRQAKLFEDILSADEATVAAIDARLEKSARALERAVDAVIAKAK